MPFVEAEFGAIGLETLMSAALRLVHSGEIPLTRLISAMTAAPARILGLESGRLAPGAPADIIVADLEQSWRVTEESLKSRSKNSPFEHTALEGRVQQTIVAGRTVYTDETADLGSDDAVARGVRSR